MRNSTPLLLSASIILCAGPLATNGDAPPESVVSRNLDALDGLQMINATGRIVSYRGRRALELVPVKDRVSEQMLAVIEGVHLSDGVIEVDVAGMRRSDASPDMRGFVGVAFRVQPNGVRYENIFVRPDNGRATEQVRRNHSTQYQALPEYPWYRLRKESPGAYESYVDLEPGAWTRIKVAVSGKRALLYVSGATQPCLVVNDLKSGDTTGSVALWTHVTSKAYFSRLMIRPAS